MKHKYPAHDVSQSARDGSHVVSFVCNGLRRRWPELVQRPDRLRLADVDPRRIGNNGESIWIVSTYLRLREAGVPVEIRSTLRPHSINIATERHFLSDHAASETFLVVPMADRDGFSWPDYRLVQSPEQARGDGVSLIGHWPQPGLVGRDKVRANRIDRLGYVGPMENLARAFRTAIFREALGRLGVELVMRDDPAQWHDYSDLDLCLAVRDWPWHLLRTKPATKLVHAWLTGVPALLGHEPAYRYCGENGVDYFEVRTPEEVLAVVRRLKEDPTLYESVRQRGFIKARHHDEQAVLRQWIEILNGPVREAFERWQQAGPLTWKYRAARRQWQRLTAPLQQKWFTLRSQGWRAVSRRLGWQEPNGCGGERKAGRDRARGAR